VCIQVVARQRGSRHKGPREQRAGTRCLDGCVYWVRVLYYFYSPYTTPTYQLHLTILYTRMGVCVFRVVGDSEEAEMDSRDPENNGYQPPDSMPYKPLPPRQLSACQRLLRLPREGNHSRPSHFGSMQDWGFTLHLCA